MADTRVTKAQADKAKVAAERAEKNYKDTQALFDQQMKLQDRIMKQLQAKDTPKNKKAALLKQVKAITSTIQATLGLVKSAKYRASKLAVTAATLCKSAVGGDSSGRDQKMDAKAVSAEVEMEQRQAEDGKHSEK